MGDSWKLDIGSAECASISYLAFEGATKKLRPNVNVGDLIYAQLSTAHRDMEPEAVCIDVSGKARGLGVLPADGFMFTVPLHVARKIISADCNLLSLLGQAIPYEIVCGLNGRIYLKTHEVKDLVAVANAISLCEHMTNDQIKDMVTAILSALQGL